MRAAIILAGVVAGVGGTAVAQAPDQVERGRQRYVAAGCWQCHGYEGQGGAGPRIGPEPLPLPAFEAYVRAPALDMPPYREQVLPAADLEAIHAFLSARQPPVRLPGASRR